MRCLFLLLAEPSSSSSFCRSFPPLLHLNPFIILWVGDGPRGTEGEAVPSAIPLTNRVGQSFRCMRQMVPVVLSMDEPSGSTINDFYQITSSVSLLYQQRGCLWETWLWWNYSLPFSSLLFCRHWNRGTLPDPSCPWSNLSKKRWRLTGGRCGVCNEYPTLI